VRFCNMKPAIASTLTAIIITAIIAQISAGENDTDLTCNLYLSSKPNIEKLGDGVALSDPSNLFIVDYKPYTADTNNDISLSDPIKDELPALDIKSPVNKDSADSDFQFLGEIKKYPLFEISSKSKTLELSIKLPAGMKFNNLAPFNIAMSSNNPEVIKPGKFNITKGTGKLILPVAISPGEAVLTIDLNFSYCETTNAELCHFKNARLEIPVKAVKNSGGNIFSVKYEVFD